MPSTIKSGSTGPDVSDWQRRLKAAGYQVAETGTFDAATEQATKSWQAANGLGADGVVGPLSWAKMTGEAPTGTTDKNAKFGRDALLEAWNTILQEAASSQYAEVRALATPPNLSELQIAGAMAQLESHYGKSPYTNKETGETAVLNNWGAVQAGKPPCNPATSFEVTDTGAQGKYNFCYKRYATPADGALDFLRHLTIKRPHSWAAMKTGDLDEYSVRMHSWTPPLEKLGAGKPSGTVQNLDPITKQPGYFEQPPLTPNGRAATLLTNATNIAYTLGEPLSVRRGGPFEGEPGPDDGGFLPSLVPKTAGQKGFLAALGVAAAIGLGYLGWTQRRRIGL